MIYFGLVPLFIVAFAIPIFLFRNNWVYRQRIAILRANMEAYNNLPSYDTMIWHFWIWDAAKFINYGEAQVDVERRENEAAAKLGRKIVARYREEQRR